MIYALDTSVVVAAVTGPSDRLWQKWTRFNQTAARERFVPRAAYERFELVVEGIGTTNPGFMELLISDTVGLIWNSGDQKPSAVEADRMGLKGNRKARVLGLIEAVERDLDGHVWSCTRACDAIRSYERDFARRRIEFFRNHPALSPSDQIRLTDLTQKLFAINPSGGVSWRETCCTIAQSALVGEDRHERVTLVTEDGHRVGTHSERILSISNLEGLVDLSLSPHRP